MSSDRGPDEARMTEGIVPGSETGRGGVQKKWARKEQKLLEQLREAQEAEARTLERFRRVQARLQRRKARIERLKSKLSHLRQHLTEELAEQQAEALKADGIKEVAILMNGLQNTILLEVDQEQEFAAEIGNGSTIDQSHEMYAVVQESSPAQEESAEDGETEIDRDVEPAATPVMVEDVDYGEIDDDDQDVDETQVPTAALPRLEIVTEDAGEPVVGDSEEGARVEDTQAESIEFTLEPKRLEADVEPTPVKEEEWAEVQISGESDAVLSQVAAKAKEEWVAAEASVQQARNVAYGIAAGIGFLTQTDISNELMQELLCKQGDANKVLVKVQETARLAYAHFIQAQEAEEALSIKQEALEQEISQAEHIRVVANKQNNRISEIDHSSTKSSPAQITQVFDRSPNVYKEQKDSDEIRPEDVSLPQPQIRHLHARLPERVRVGERIPLQVRVALSSAPSRSISLRAFSIPPSGTDLKLVLDCPGFLLHSDSMATVHVTAGVDSDWVLFELEALHEGVSTLEISAFNGGAFLGTLSLQLSVDSLAMRGHSVDRLVLLPLRSPQEGEVTLVIRYDPLSTVYRYQFRGTSFGETYGGTVCQVHRHFSCSTFEYLVRRRRRRAICSISYHLK